MPVMTRNRCTTPRADCSSRHKRDLGKSETIDVAKDSPRPESQNPIAKKKKPINAAQAWLQ
jgi:hypothetical protein